MLESGVSRLNRTIRRARWVAQQALTSVCDESRHVLDVEFGGRVWLLPPWYALAAHKASRIPLAWAEMGVRLLGRPRMILVAKVFGPLGEGSSIKWTVGKGLVGRLTFDGVQFDVLHHHGFGPPTLTP